MQPGIFLSLNVSEKEDDYSLRVIINGSGKMVGLLEDKVVSDRGRR